MTDEYRRRMPSVEDLPAEIYPRNASGASLFETQTAQARALVAHSQQHRDTAYELGELRKTITPVADMLLRDSQKTAIQKHWASIYAVVLPLASLAISVFVSWYLARHP